MEATLLPTGMKDHQWMSVLAGIAVLLVPVNSAQMVCVLLLHVMNTHIRTCIYARILL